MSRFAVSIVLCLIGSSALAQESPPKDAKPSDGSNSTGNAVVALDSIFKSLDKNGDGKISKDEATGAYGQRFANWDADGDGFATREEIRAFRKQRGIDDEGKRIAVAGAGRNAAARAKTSENVLLKEPADWREEQMAVPPGFAPDITLTGSEECQFSPGMYDTKSPQYFSYAVALTLDGNPKLEAAEFKTFLESYFRGLSTAVGRGKGLKPDVQKMVATVTSAVGEKGKNKLSAEMVFVDSFTDGRTVTLNIEAEIVVRTAAKKTYVVVLISPSSRDSATWKELREVGVKAARNIPME